MKDGKPNSQGEPERRPASAGRRGGGPKKQRGFADRERAVTERERGFIERATARGHSGYGSESVRPYLRDQLRLKSLLPRGTIGPEDPLPGKDEHHR